MNAPARTLGAAPAQRRETNSPTLTDLHIGANVIQARWELDRAETEALQAAWARKWGQSAVGRSY